MLRQEDLDLQPAGAEGLRATVATRVYLGARIRYVLDAAGTRLRVLAGNDRRFDRGDAVTVTIRPDAVVVIRD